MIGHKRLNDVGRALQYLVPEGIHWSVRSEEGSALDPEQPGVVIEYQEPYADAPTAQQIRDKIKELNNNEPMRCVKELRDKFLKDSDWTETPSLQTIKSAEWHAEWQAYRTALRNLPNKMRTGDWTPIFDEQGLLHLSNFPKPPTE
jgi:hypothetical protein